MTRPEKIFLCAGAAMELYLVTLYFLTQLEGLK